jgi:hypothetical protein
MLGALKKVYADHTGSLRRELAGARVVIRIFPSDFCSGPFASYLRLSQTGLKYGTFRRRRLTMTSAATRTTWAML